MTRVLVDRDITPTDRLLAGVPDSWDVEVGIDKADGDVTTSLDGVRVMFVTSRVPMTRAVIERADDLDIIAKLGTGIDSVDCEAARENGVTVTYTPGHNALAVAEHAVTLALAVGRRLPHARNVIENDGWRDQYTLGSRLSGSTVGVVGFGNVGKRVGRLLTGFDVDLLAHDPYVPSIDAELTGADLVSLDDLLAESDVVVTTVELTEETTGLVGADELDAMKEDAILVNTARGPVVDEDALLDALRADAIGGAGLDVFETEPLGGDSPLLDFENVVVTPHVAAMTRQTREETIDQITANVRALTSGERLDERYLATPRAE
ncbi:MAG: NAD(P)-dependent oxidoreductase [Halarchaeum sp.]